jgi:2,3-bisphosphoglycerate-independent phosphoglycerate mutase
MKKVLLIIMDGWGCREALEGNAIRLAKTPNVDALWEKYPHTKIHGSGTYVGLPEGQMGNSEVGHLNLGAGRVVYQDIVRIDRTIADGTFFDNEALTAACDTARKNGTALHIMGLVSDGGVHSHQNHLHALVRMAAQRGVERFYVHAILDGRDTPPHSGVNYLAILHDALVGTRGRIASVVGRYYCMDRDKRWDRTGRAYDMLTLGEGHEVEDPCAAVRESYERDVTDEFVEPIVVTENGKPVATIDEGDTVIFFNFRADRARQITHAINDDDFDGFERKKRVKVHFTCMTQYEDTFHLPVAFPPERRTNILAEVASNAGMTTLRIAETEKYAHVTYFFNGGEEEEWKGETRILVPSPKVATYDLQPEMSAYGVCDRLVAEIEADRHDYIVCNFANPDMVGHTGVLDAAVKAVETVDICIGRIMEVIDSERMAVIVTSDHGNADQMIDTVNDGAYTAHTTNLVPCILVDPDYHGELIEGGSLRDIAPTILNYLEVPVPEEMTGRDLRADRG